MSVPFIHFDPQPADYWRGIVLFGRNVASYKFALAQSLLDLRPSDGQLVRLEELARPFSRHLCAHLREADKQGTSRQSRFLEACRRANAGEITTEELVEQTVRLGFNNVIDAFHVVGQDEIPHRFFLDERKNGGIRVTEHFSKLLEGPQVGNLPAETDARWRLVETAWELGVNPGLLAAVDHDAEAEVLFVVDAARRRRPITGIRGALNGYQKGCCFYCYADMAITTTEPPDVDHFFPHSLRAAGMGPIVDGVWNLVLACRACNRGANGKFNRIPTLRLLERLSTRNEFLIDSHHPLRETLMAQTGNSPVERRGYLAAFHQQARAALIHEWEPVEVRELRF